MNQFDATATPMFDCFTDTPDFTPFDARAEQHPARHDEPAQREDRRSPCCASHAVQSGELNFRRDRRLPRGHAQPHPLARRQGPRRPLPGLGRHPRRRTMMIEPAEKSAFSGPGELSVKSGPAVFPRRRSGHGRTETPRLDHRPRLLRDHPRPGLEGHAPEAEDLRRVLPGRPQPRLAHRRRLHLRLEHRRRAPRRPGRLGRDRRRGHGPLRAPRLVPARPGLGHGAVLHALEGLHHARVPGAALLAGRPDGPVAHLARRLRPDQDGRRHLRRRRRLQRPPARAQLVLGLDSFWIGSILVIVITGLYTVLGGLQGRGLHRGHADVHPHHRLGPGDLLRPQGPRRLGRAPARSSAREMFNLWKPLVPAGVEGTWAPVKEAGRMAWYFNDNYPWIGMLFCAPIIGLWYWCTDQYIVQRVLGAPNEREARRGSIAAAFFKLLPVFIFIIPGMIAFALAKSGQNPALQQELFARRARSSSGPTPRRPSRMLVATVLPVGVRGMVVAGLLAALMSSLAGAFNAASTLFTMDFYQRLQARR
ncbi:MAG: hypothetical protein MZV64_63140 [Ignavibacteriales bacterium]|nr:hypothetical protein [Ignavibacteriales bacterium]